MFCFLHTQAGRFPFDWAEENNVTTWGIWKDLQEILIRKLLEYGVLTVNRVPKCKASGPLSDDFRGRCRSLMMFVRAADDVRMCCAFPAPSPEILISTNTLLFDLQWTMQNRINLRQSRLSSRTALSFIRTKIVCILSFDLVLSLSRFVLQGSPRYRGVHIMCLIVENPMKICDNSNSLEDFE